jgi:hypothetical protein
MPHALFIVTLGIAAVLFALLEIQIEGPHGWAASLPTWRVDNRWTRLFYSSKPLTGYHLYTQLFALALVHLPFALRMAPLTWRMEARVLSFFILFWVLEDFLWFLLNPAFGLKRFRPENICGTHPNGGGSCHAIIGFSFPSAFSSIASAMRIRQAKMFVLSASASGALIVSADPQHRCPMPSWQSRGFGE